MKLSFSLPETAIFVDTYARLRKYVTAFAEGHHGLLVIVGSGGIGKTQIVERSMFAVHGVEGWAPIKGKHTPLHLYEMLYQYRDQPLILDDLDGLLENRDNVTTLKCVCDTTPQRLVQWGSNHALFSRPESPLPQRFVTSSRVCILTNEWKRLDRNLTALFDRAVVVIFEPSAYEVHAEIGRSGWFDDAEVFDFIGQHLFLVARPSLRLYLRAREFKSSRDDWREPTLQSMGKGVDPKTLLVASLLADPRYDASDKPGKAREAAFREMGGGDRATYYRRKRCLQRLQSKGNAFETNKMVLQPCVHDSYTEAVVERYTLVEQACVGLTQTVESTDTRLCPAATSQHPGEERTEQPTDRIVALRQEMDRAAGREDYEAAARLRDEIRALSTRQAGDRPGS